MEEEENKPHFQGSHCETLNKAKVGLNQKTHLLFKKISLLQVTEVK